MAIENPPENSPPSLLFFTRASLKIHTSHPSPRNHIFHNRCGVHFANVLCECMGANATILRGAGSLPACVCFYARQYYVLPNQTRFTSFRSHSRRLSRWVVLDIRTLRLSVDYVQFKVSKRVAQFLNESNLGNLEPLLFRWCQLVVSSNGYDICFSLPMQ